MDTRARNRKGEKGGLWDWSDKRRGCNDDSPDNLSRVDQSPITSHFSDLISEPQRRRLLLFSYKAKWWQTRLRG